MSNTPSTLTEGSLMFEHTSLLSSKGHYETTASHVEAVRERTPGSGPSDRRSERRDSVRRATVQRLWNERRRNRRHRTAS